LKAADINKRNCSAARVSRMKELMKVTLSIFLTIVFLVVAMAQERPSELSGYLKNPNKLPAKGVVVSVGNFSVASNADGYYRITGVRPGWRIVSLAPPGKATKSFRVLVNSTPTRKDFPIDW